MYMSQEMLKLRRFLARFWLSDNQMTIILEIIYQLIASKRWRYFSPKSGSIILYSMLSIHVFFEVHFFMCFAIF